MVPSSLGEVKRGIVVLRHSKVESSEEGTV